MKNVVISHLSIVDSTYFFLLLFSYRFPFSMMITQNHHLSVIFSACLLLSKRNKIANDKGQGGANTTTVFV